MSASIDTTGLAALAKSLRRAVGGDLQRAMVANIQDSGPKIVAEMHGAAFTKIQKRAVGSVTVKNSSAGIDISGGGGGSLGATLFDGGEYGGRKGRKVAYTSRSPLGRPYAVRRRTTMMFLPHLGREGYFFWVTIRDWLPKLVKQQEALIEKALGGR